MEAVDPDSNLWQNWRSFFITTKGSVKMDFESKENGVSLLGSIKQSDFAINELKVFKGENEATSE